MNSKDFHGLTINAPLNAQRVDAGDPNVTMDDLEKFLDVTGCWALFNARQDNDLNAVRKIVKETGDWITWVRYQASILGDADSWEPHVRARFRALYGWTESFYQYCCDTNLSMTQKSTQKLKKTH